MIPILKKVQYALITCSLLTPISVSLDVGVAECVCSGVSDECHHEPRVVTSVSVSAVDNIFSITDRDPTTWLGDNKPRFHPQSQTIKYKVIPQDSSIFFWSMPSVLKGIE